MKQKIYFHSQIGPDEIQTFGEEELKGKKATAYLSGGKLVGISGYQKKKEESVKS